MPESVENEIVEITGNLGKTPVEVNDVPEIAVNRILLPIINEAMGIYAEGVAKFKGIATHPLLQKMVQAGKLVRNTG